MWLEPRVIVAATFFFLSSPASELQRYEFQEPHMGTTARVVLYAPDPTSARIAADAAFARIGELDARLSDYRDTSELMAVCRRAGGAPVAVSDDLFNVLTAARSWSIRTDGAFDVTIGPLTRLWRRARARGAPPDEQELAAARRLVGYSRLELSVEQRDVRLVLPGMLLDLGGIAKGYAADQALATLRAHGKSRALVALAGDIAAGDAPPGARVWHVGVAPLGPSVQTAVPSLSLQRRAVSTSGDAEQYLEQAGVRYSHILTPRTGNAVTGRIGVTVVADDGTTADALATAVSVLGVDAGLRLVDETPGAAALILELTADGIREHRSRAW